MSVRDGSGSTAEPEHADEADAPAPRAPKERKLGRYTLLLELAHGGMATVFLARAGGAAGFEKLVAVKRIHPHLATEKSFVDMFLDEASIAAGINHANVCSVFDFGQEQDTYYIAMEYLVGEPLSRVAKISRQLTLDGQRHAALIARVMADACEGIHAAHELRDASGELLHIVHRDVSPQNLFVTLDGVVKVVDFGIAKARERLHQTTSGILKGKHAYMAPEQLQHGQVDRRADVWALGVVLWEMLTLRRLFKRDTHLESLFAVVSSNVARPSQVQPTLPRELDEIVMRALAREPDDRYPTARDLGRDLHRFLSSQPVPVSLPDVADWMETLFPDGRRRHQQLLAVAAQLGEADPIVNVDVDLGSESMTNAPSSVRRAPGYRGSFRRWRWPLAVVLALGAGILGTWAIVRPTTSPTGVQEIAATGGPASATEPQPGSGAEPEPGPEPGSEAEPEPGPEADAEHQDTSTRPRRSETGSVDLATPGGWALVRTRSGRSLGQTPVRVTLPVGRHALELLPFGRAPARTVTVRVRAGRVGRVSVPLR